MTNLADLPETHPLRNRPLKEVDARCDGKSVVTWAIKNNTYNELGEVWKKRTFIGRITDEDNYYL